MMLYFYFFSVSHKNSSQIVVTEENYKMTGTKIYVFLIETDQLHVLFREMKNYFKNIYSLKNFRQYIIQV